MRSKNLYALLAILSLVNSGCSIVKTDTFNQTAEYYHGRTPSQNHRVFVFVHGIFGSPYITWQTENGKYFFDLIKNDTSNEFKNSDVYVFGYSTGFFKGATAPTIDEVATQLAVYLKQEHVDEYDQIIFVAHSMGGLISLKCLMQHPEIAEKTPLAFLYSTPLAGSEIAQLGKVFSSQSIALTPTDSEDSINAYLQSLVDEWRNEKFNKRITTTLRCAYEKERTPIGFIVSSNSARLICDGLSAAIQASHITMFNNAGYNSLSYLALKDAVAHMQDENKISITHVMPVLVSDSNSKQPLKLIFLVEAVNRSNFDVYPTKLVLTGTFEQPMKSNSQPTESSRKTHLAQLGTSTGVLKNHSANVFQYELFNFTETEKIQDAWVFLNLNRVEQAVSNPDAEAILTKNENNTPRLIENFSNGLFRLAIDTGGEQIVAAPDTIMDLSTITDKELADPHFMAKLVIKLEEKYLRHRDIGKPDATDGIINLPMGLNSPKITGKSNILRVDVNQTVPAFGDSKLLISVKSINKDADNRLIMHLSISTLGKTKAFSGIKVGDRVPYAGYEITVMSITSGYAELIASY
jgi:esterase/lipase superfamily enzyme